MDKYITLVEGNLVCNIPNGMTNREIISEFVERDDSFAIMIDEVNETVNIELSLDFWNAPYKEGE